MDKKSIIQWNCRGLRANYNEILILMSLFSPSVICLQETFLKQSDNISFRDFNMFNYICPDGQRASGGLNSRTPVKKVWDMIRKVSGKNKKSECVHIKSSNGNMCYVFILNRQMVTCVTQQRTFPMH